ncbi:hypothetical protein Athai_66020 [Actinocatenispora thailandica]|uniref:Uncharacterized protein n=1 Tax=Actinocatenispora thailandica TaxID=227318 RepID=A0A7R7DWL8_9ACTN|nr:hypothetical protein [Actinocatenispora thailandica]BCJ39099.1 hypothetical protein Athai_66020 [Actinocatenispora thailandica]
MAPLRNELTVAAAWIRVAYGVGAAGLVTLSFRPPFGPSAERFDGEVTVTRHGSLWHDAHDRYSWAVPMLLCLLAAVMLLAVAVPRRAPNRGHLVAILFPTGFLAAMLFGRAGTWTLDGKWAPLTPTGVLTALLSSSLFVLAFAHIMIVWRQSVRAERQRIGAGV